MCARVLLSDDLPEVQTQIKIIIIIVISDSEDNNDDDNKRWEEAAEIAKINITRVINQSEKRNTQPQTQ